MLRKNTKKPGGAWQRIPKGTESLLAHDFAGKVECVIPL